MKKILITGAGGFIGSHLCEFFVKKGYNIKAFLRYNSKNDWGWLENSEMKSEIEVFLGDIRDFDSVNKAMSNCDSVIHLAALIGIPYSYISPLAYIKTNLEGTYNVLESAKLLKLENILITSTSEVYGTAQYTPINEFHPIIGQSPYSASKIASDHLSISYQKSFNLPIKIVRPFNTYGPRQSARAIIPTIISQLLRKERIINLGNLTPTRDLTYVLDTVNGFYKIFESKIFGEVINIGMNYEITVKDLVAKIAQLMSINYEIYESEERKRPYLSEVERLLCDNKKLINNYGWVPEYNLEKGLISTISWFQNNLNKIKYNLYNV